jgi:predicted acetyltransferase
MKITHRYLNEIEVHQVFDFIKTTPNITYYEIEELRKIPSFIVIIDNKSVGFCFYKEIKNAIQSVEISVFIVFNEYQNQGIGRKLFEETFSYLNKFYHNFRKSGKFYYFLRRQ